MSQDFIKSLDPYETNDGSPIAGNYHFDIPHDIEPNCYEMTIDYESHDEQNPDAFQYKGYIVVGRRAYLKTGVIHIPYDTVATSEEAITLYEKRNTTFNAVCEAFKYNDYTGAVKQLPLDIRFRKGDFRDYHANPSTAQTKINEDYEAGYSSTTKPNPVKTNNNGKSTTTFKISDVYGIEETINDINTIFFRLNGTRDRGTDNYVPAIIEAPCILGTTHVSYYKYTGNDTDFIRINQTDVNFALPSDSDNNPESEYLIATCGKGKTLIGTDLIYRFAQTVNYTAKTNYEHYTTDPNYHCKVGKFYLGWREYTPGTHEEYTRIPASQLEAVNEHTTILSDGAIIQTPGNESGGVRVYWTNDFAHNASKPIQYRWEYVGKVGATFDQLSPDYGMVIDPQFGTSSTFETKITMSSTSYTSNPQEPVTISGTLKEKISGSWVDPVDYDGYVMIKEGNTVLATLTPNAHGEFSTQLTKGTGTYNLTAQFHDNNGSLEDSTKAFTLTVRSPLAVTINPSTNNGSSLRADAFDTGTSDSHTITFNLEDEYGRPVEHGNLEIFLKSNHWQYAGRARQSVGTQTISNGGVTVNSYNLFTQSFKESYTQHNLFLHSRYTISVRYTDATGRYATQTNLNLSGDNTLTATYRPKEPKLEMKIYAKAPGANSFTQLTSGTDTDNNVTTPAVFTQFRNLGNYPGTDTPIPNGDIGYRTPFNVALNSQIKIEFCAKDTYGNRMGGIGYHSWLNPDHEIVIYRQNEDGTFVLDGNGNKKPYATTTVNGVEPIKRQLKICEDVYNEETEEMDRVCEDVTTPINLNPCYPILPIPQDTLLWDEYVISNGEHVPPKEATSNSSDNTLIFTLPEECNNNTYMFIGFSFHALWAFGSASNDVVLATESIRSRYHKDTNLDDGTDDSYWDPPLVQNAQTGEWEFANPVTHRYGVVFNITFNTST